MTKVLQSQTRIAATPAHVWQALVSFDAYAEWNPFIVRAVGRPVVGDRLELRMQPVESKAITLRPTVLEATPNRRLRWLGHLGMPGLMDAEHTFELTAMPDGDTLLAQSETFRGILVPMAAKMLDRHTLPAFYALNEALRQRVERVDLG